eukprot:3763998-Heterocapsa_arctica.AAC.1
MALSVPPGAEKVQRDRSNDKNLELCRATNKSTYREPKGTEKYREKAIIHKRKPNKCRTRI